MVFNLTEYLSKKFNYQEDIKNVIQYLSPKKHPKIIYVNQRTFDALVVFFGTFYLWENKYYIEDLCFCTKDSLGDGEIEFQEEF